MDLKTTKDRMCGTKQFVRKQIIWATFLIIMYIIFAYTVSKIYQYQMIKASEKVLEQKKDIQLLNNIPQWKITMEKI